MSISVHGGSISGITMRADIILEMIDDRYLLGLCTVRPHGTRSQRTYIMNLENVKVLEHRERLDSYEMYRKRNYQLHSIKTNSLTRANNSQCFYVRTRVFSSATFFFFFCFSPSLSLTVR